MIYFTTFAVPPEETFQASGPMTKTHINSVNSKCSHSRESGNPNPLNLDDILTEPIFLRIKSYGLIDEIALRNLIIKNEYRTLRHKLHLGDAVYELSQKYFLSEHAINNILFRKRNKKPINFPNKIYITL